MVDRVKDGRDVTDRQTLQAAFLEKAGWADAAIAPIAGDASTRSYLRLARGQDRAVLMNAPPAAEGAACPPNASPAERAALGYNAEARLAGPNLNAFTELARLLRGAGLDAPDIYAADPATGFALIEDLGDDLYVRVLEGGGDEAMLYDAAIDALVHLHGQSLPRPQADHYSLLDYDETALTAEAALLVDWYWPYLRGEDTPPEIAADYRAMWHRLLGGLSEPHTLVLRDFHAENILWIEGDRPRVGVIDFQDGLFGHAAYDLVSLLEDARRDVSAPVVERSLSRYLAARGEAVDEAGFRRDYAILAAQRNAKILGVFARLIVRDGKPRYESFMPRVRGHFARDLQRAEVAPLKDWISRHLPELLTP